MERKKSLFLSLLLCTAIAMAMLYTSYEAAAYGERFLGKGRVWRIVIDPGHGGTDPGKVGANGIKESDINLEIAKKLERLFAAAGASVYLTRQEDASTYENSKGFHKVKDMEARTALVKEKGADVLISIHQNSYSDASVSGPQVFFYGQSAEGKKLAEIIQSSIIERIKPAKERQIKAENSYYLLKEAEAVAVIVECGFLSNPEELKLLVREEYQEQMAWAIYMGVMSYLQGGGAMP